MWHSPIVAYSVCYSVQQMLHALKTWGNCLLCVLNRMRPGANINEWKAPGGAFCLNESPFLCIPLTPVTLKNTNWWRLFNFSDSVSTPVGFHVSAMTTSPSSLLMCPKYVAFPIDYISSLPLILPGGFPVRLYMLEVTAKGGYWELMWQCKAFLKVTFK